MNSSEPLFCSSLQFNDIACLSQYLDMHSCCSSLLRSGWEANYQFGNTMDTELAALQVRRDKTQAVKQGMMQELLTGRIRLV